MNSTPQSATKTTTSSPLTTIQGLVNEAVDTIPAASVRMAGEYRRKGHNLPVYTPKRDVAPAVDLSLTKATMPIVEIFDSVQGEGLNSGVPMTFVRFSHCNLACDFCDTPYDRVSVRMTATNLLTLLLEKQPKWVMFTGGEPCLSLKASLVKALKVHGIKCGIETNGTVPAIEMLKELDYITISPKLWVDIPGNAVKHIIAPEIVNAVQDKVLTIGEIRYLIGGDRDDIFRLPNDIHLLGAALVLSPMVMDNDPSPTYVSGKGHQSPFGTVDPASFRRCMYLANKYRHLNVRISVQMHKLVGVR